VTRLVRVAGIIAAALVLVIAVSLLVGQDHPGPRPAPWSDARLAAALTAMAAGAGATVMPGDVPALLARDCPYLPDPVGLAQRYGGSEAQADAVMSVIAQSGRC
jgi:hypothetical protein